MKKLPELILSSILGIIVTIMFIQVVFRYLLNNSLSWSEEITRYLFVWLVFLGSALCIRDRLHIGVDFLHSKLTTKGRLILEKLNLILISAFNLTIAITGWMWVIETHGSISPAIGLPLNLVFYAALPTTALIGLYYSISQLIRKQTAA